MIPDADGPYESVAALVDAVPSGSYLALSHLADDVDCENTAVVSDRHDELMPTTNPPAVRSRADAARLFAGLDLVEPGLVPASGWRPDEAAAGRPRGQVTRLFSGVARKP